MDLFKVAGYIFFSFFNKSELNDSERDISPRMHDSGPTQLKKKLILL